jgi:hypothetical protein
MPIYMQIDGVKGPKAFQKFTGYFDVDSIRFFRGYKDDHNRSVPPSFAFVRPNDSATPRLLALLHEPEHSTPRDVLFVYAGGEAGKPLEEFKSVWVHGAVMLSYQSSSDVNTFVFQYDHHDIEPPAAVQSSLLRRPQDWGRVQAAKYFTTNTSATV